MQDQLNPATKEAVSFSHELKFKLEANPFYDPFTWEGLCDKAHY